MLVVPDNFSSSSLASENYNWSLLLHNTKKKPANCKEGLKDAVDEKNTLLDIIWNSVSPSRMKRLAVSASR